MLPLLAFGGKQAEVGAYDDGDDNRPPSISMIPSLSKINIDVKYDSLPDLEKIALDTVVNKDNFMLIAELNNLKTLRDSINKVKQRVDEIAEGSATPLTQSDFVTMMEEALSANDFQLLKEYNNLRSFVADSNTFERFLEKKYGEMQIAFLFNQFSENDFELLKDYNRIVEERKFAKLSLFLRAIDKDTGDPKYIPLEYDHSTGFAGINLKKSIDFQRIYLGHEKVVGYHGEAEHRTWDSIPDGMREPIGAESMREYMNDDGPHIVHIAEPGAKPIALFSSIYHDKSDGYTWGEKLDELWLDEEVSDEEEESPPDEEEESPPKYPVQAAAYYPGRIEELVLGDDSLVNEDVFPGLIQMMDDTKLFNPLFWYERDEMKETVFTEGEEWKIEQISNVGLAYYAIPSKLLAWAVDKLLNPRATKRSKPS
jgi:hypothetical protein